MVSLTSRVRGGAAAVLASRLVSHGWSQAMITGKPGATCWQDVAVKDPHEGLQAWICLTPSPWLPQLTQAACERGGANSRQMPNQ